MPKNALFLLKNRRALVAPPSGGWPPGYPPWRNPGYAPGFKYYGCVPMV